MMLTACGDTVSRQANHERLYYIADSDLYLRVDLGKYGC